jgi:hypothetical protein
LLWKIIKLTIKMPLKATVSVFQETYLPGEPVNTSATRRKAETNAGFARNG